MLLKNVKLYTCTLTNGEFKIPAQIIPPVDWKDTQEDVETQLEPGTIISVEEGNYSNKIQQRQHVDSWHTPRLVAAV